MVIPPNPFRAFWQLRPDVLYLNHGSYGALPRTVREVQLDLQRRLDEQPIDFLSRERETLLNLARERLAEFLGAAPAGLVFVRNATEGINSVLRSLRFSAGDEIVISNHEYNATKNIVDYVAEFWSAKVVTVELPLRAISNEMIRERFIARLTDHTKLVVCDHVTSQSAIIFPVTELCQSLNERAIPTLVDGSHAPGMVPINLKTLGATYYIGNCHKWLCAPKGVGFLYVHEEKERPNVRPAIVSHGANSPRTDKSRYQLEFDWTGTQDYSPALCIPAALDFLATLVPGGISQVMKLNHSKVVAARKAVCSALEIEPFCDELLLGSMASIELPPGDAAELGERLRSEFNMEPLVLNFPGASQRLVRISAQMYNSDEEYLVLADALRKILRY